MIQRLAAAMLFAVGLTFPAMACECAQINPPQQSCPFLDQGAGGKPSSTLSNAQSVDQRILFVGTVFSADPVPEANGDPQKVVRLSRYKFLVEEAFSGVNAGQIDIYSSRDCCDCGVSFKVGGRYLVDARGANGVATATICSNTRAFHASDPLIAQLRAIRDGMKSASLFGTLRSVEKPWDFQSDPAEIPALPGRTVRLLSPSRAFEAKTDADGHYRFADLPPDTYSVSVDLSSDYVLRDFVVFHRKRMHPIRVVEGACGEYNLYAFPASQAHEGAAAKTR